MQRHREEPRPNFRTRTTRHRRSGNTYTNYRTSTNALNPPSIESWDGHLGTSLGTNLGTSIGVPLTAGATRDSHRTAGTTALGPAGYNRYWTAGDHSHRVSRPTTGYWPAGTTAIGQQAVVRPIIPGTTATVTSKTQTPSLAGTITNGFISMRTGSVTALPGAGVTTCQARLQPGDHFRRNELWRRKFVRNDAAKQIPFRQIPSGILS